MNYAFYNGKLLEEYEPESLSSAQLGGEQRQAMPTGTYVYNQTRGYWYHYIYANFANFVTEDEVPAIYRTQMLLLT